MMEMWCMVLGVWLESGLVSADTKCMWDSDGWGVKLGVWFSRVWLGT